MPTSNETALVELRETLPIDTTSPVLQLNNAHAEELSPLDAARMSHLIAEAFMAVCIGAADALLIAFDEMADYDSANFLWFRDRYDRFVYVDRIVVDPVRRGQGLARRLYERLFEAARAAGHTRVACEVNADPPNPASDAFHAALGFVEVGAARLEGRGKSVRYFLKALG